MTYVRQRSSFLVFLACAVSAGLTAGCGGDTNTTFNEEPLVIEAYIEGTVVDGITRAPIEGATVTVPGIAGGTGSFTTEENGFYSLAVPGVGAHTVFVEATDYARAKYTVNATTEPGASGNIRVTAVRNSQLYPKTGTLNGRVTSGGDRDIVAGAGVLVQFTDSADPIEDASLTIRTTTDKAGTFTLDELPAGSPQTRVTIFPADLNDDDVPDTATFSSFVTGGTGGGALTPDSQNFMDISVDQFIADKVLGSNLDNAATIAPTDPLVLTYAQPMVQTQDAITVTLREGTVEIAAEASWSNEVELSIQPREPLLAGHTYSLAVQAISLSGTSVTFNRTFSVASDEAPLDAVTGAELVDPAPVAWNAKSFNLAFDLPATPPQGYRVFARNNQLQTQWAVVFEGLVSRFGRPQVRVTLPDAFDTFPSDDAFSAVGFGTIVEFAIQPFNGKNDGAFPDDPDNFASLADTACPRISVASSNTTDNIFGTDPIRAKYLLSSAGGEPIADDPAPVFTFATGPSSTDTTLLRRASMQLRRVRADQFEVSFAVPVGESGAGDAVTVDVSGVTDTSGNAPDGTLDCPDTVTFVSN